MWSEATGREQAFGSIFTTLDRLSDKKFVNWKKGDPDVRRGGRAPRLYSITASVRSLLISSLTATQALTSGIDGLPVPIGE